MSYRINKIVQLARGARRVFPVTGRQKLLELRDNLFPRDVDKFVGVRRRGRRRCQVNIVATAIWNVIFDHTDAAEGVDVDVPLGLVVAFGGADFEFPTNEPIIGPRDRVWTPNGSLDLQGRVDLLQIEPGEGEIEIIPIGHRHEEMFQEGMVQAVGVVRNQVMKEQPLPVLFKMFAAENL